MARRRRLPRARRSRRGTIRGAGKLVSGSVKVKTRRMRGRTRHCVEAKARTKAPGFSGQGSTKRFYGCFISAADARTQAQRLERAAG